MGQGGKEEDIFLLACLYEGFYLDNWFFVSLYAIHLRGMLNFLEKVKDKINNSPKFLEVFRPDSLFICKICKLFASMFLL